MIKCFLLSGVRLKFHRSKLGLRGAYLGRTLSHRRRWTENLIFRGDLDTTTSPSACTTIAVAPPPATIAIISSSSTGEPCFTCFVTATESLPVCGLGFRVLFFFFSRTFSLRV